MKRFLILLLLLPAVLVTAQDRLTGVYHPYPSPTAEPAKAPSGYKPFYLSHIGRHGCRHLSFRKDVYNSLEALRKADREGILTPAGKLLLQKSEEVAACSDNLWGELTPRGEQEHREIGARMVKRFPQVFRDSVRAVASIYRRCIISMAASTGEIRSLSPKAKVSYYVGKRYQSTINQLSPAIPGRPAASELKKAYIKQHISEQDFLSRIFTDPEKARGMMKNFHSFMESVYLTWAIREAVSLQPFELSEVLGEYNTAEAAGAVNLAYYHNMVIPASDSLMSNILERASLAIDSGRPSADLRYGHDSGILKFLTAAGFEGFTSGLPPEEGARFEFSEKMPMCSNFQMVLYKSRRGPVLVRFLFNERDLLLKDFPGGPFYKWEDVKAKWTAE